MENIWLLTLIPIALIFIWWTMKGGIKVQKFHVITRCIMVTLLIIAIASPNITIAKKQRATVFVIDNSLSMKDFESSSQRFIEDALKTMPSREVAGVVVFGENSKIDTFLSDAKTYPAIRTEINDTATNIEEAMSTAIHLLPDDYAGQIVLVTDGMENSGNMQNVVSKIKKNDIALKVYEVKNQDTKEVYVDALIVPKELTKGQKFNITTKIYSSVDTNATITLYCNNQPKANQDVNLEKGYNSFVFSDTEDELGLKNYKVVVEASDDTELGNNEYVAYSKIGNVPKVLQVKGNMGTPDAFTSILTNKADYNTVDVAELSITANELNMYDLVILNNVFMDDLKESFVENLNNFVKANAGGLIIAGGNESYAPGGYKDTLLEEMSPVYMYKKGKQEMPKTSLGIVIDTSGSMESNMSGDYATGNGGGGASKINLAKSAAVNALEHLNEQDEVSVISFDDQYSIDLPRTQMSEKDKIAETINNLNHGGGTSIYPALAAAYEAQQGSDAQSKHIILLTDGQDMLDIGRYKQLLENMKNDKITLSTVAIGNDADTKLLQGLADAADGRAYVCTSARELPRIFVKEIFLAQNEYINNDTFTPAIKESHSMLEALDNSGLPQLHGYVSTTIKPLATEILKSNEDEPILVTWQYGAGKVTAWTSDVNGKWSSDFINSDSGQNLLNAMMTQTMTKYEDNENFNVKAVGKKFKLEVNSDYDSEHPNKKLIGRYMDNAGEMQEVELINIAPGKYETEVEIDASGVYKFTVNEEDNGQVLNSYSQSVVKQYLDEYKINSESNNLAEFMKNTNAQQIVLGKDVFTGKYKAIKTTINISMWLMLIAFLIFCIDVVTRRLNIKVQLAGTTTEKIKETIVNIASKDNEAINNIEKHEVSENFKTKKVNKTRKKSIEIEQQEKVNTDKMVEKSNKQKKKKEDNMLDTQALLSKKRYK